MSSAAVVIGPVSVNPVAHRKAKIVCSYGLSECNRVKGKWILYWGKQLCLIVSRHSLFYRDGGGGGGGGGVASLRINSSL